LNHELQRPKLCQFLGIFLATSMRFQSLIEQELTEKLLYYPLVTKRGRSASLPEMLVLKLLDDPFGSKLDICG
jgi:hypothetical protein